MYPDPRFVFIVEYYLKPRMSNVIKILSAEKSKEHPVLKRVTVEQAMDGCNIILS
jgi:hypothetical protein